MSNTSPSSSLFIGLMSGTSLDGVDGILASFEPDNSDGIAHQVLASAYVPFPTELRSDLMALQASGNDEIHREALAANALAQYYAECVAKLLAQGHISRDAVKAVGVHGQTIRHRPECGYTRQTNNPALLAELTGIDIIADLRSRDIAAGGQGAPLVPAFHHAIFSSPNETRVVANIGGISNISILPHDKQAQVIGFDTGPGNVLMDAWAALHLGKPYDECGTWAASGKINQQLLSLLRDEMFFTLAPPKSTGRDLFHMQWLENKLAQCASIAPCDVQATLTSFTAITISDAIAQFGRNPSAVYVCGGGAYNTTLLRDLRKELDARGQTTNVQSTDALGVPPHHVEALAFAWLAHRFT
jgi:anhydro-N-acetylmuramic acid kinase